MKYNRFSTVRYIFKIYAQAGWAVRIFVLVRYLVCPWEKIVSRLTLGGGNQTLLDIGCGHGLLLHLIQKKAPKAWELVGTDHDGAKINIARQSIPDNADMTFWDTSQHPLPSQMFDCITLVDVLYAVDPRDWPQIWKIIHGHLAPDGILLIKETVSHPKLKYWICLLQEIVATKILKYTKGEFPFLPPAEHYLKILAQNGFDIIEHGRVDQGYLWPHYLFVAKYSAVGTIAPQKGEGN